MSKDQFNKVQLISQMGSFPLEIDTATLSPDGSLIAVASADTGIALWNINVRVLYSQLDIPTETLQNPQVSIYKSRSIVWRLVHQITFSHDGAFVAAALTNHEVGIWTSEGFLLATIKRPAVSVTFLAQDDLLAVCLENGQIEFWEISPPHLISTLNDPARVSNWTYAQDDLIKQSIMSSSDGTQLAHLFTVNNAGVAGLQAMVHIWNLKQQEGNIVASLQRTINGPSQFLSFGEYTWKKHELLCSAHGHLFWVVNTDTGNTITSSSLQSLGVKLRMSTMSPLGTLIAHALWDGTVVIWSVPDQKVIMQFQAHEVVQEEVDAISAIAWLPDGKRLITLGTTRSGKAHQGQEAAVAARHSTLRVWDLGGV